MHAHTARLTQTFLQANGINAFAIDWSVTCMSADLEPDREFVGRAEETSSAQSPASALEPARTWESAVGRVHGKISFKGLYRYSKCLSVNNTSHTRVNTHVNKKKSK